MGATSSLVEKLGKKRLDFIEQPGIFRLPLTNSYPRDPITMAVAIRLRQIGAHNHPVYRVVAVDQRKKRDGGFLDQLGTYDPQKEKNPFSVDVAKFDAWIAKGAQPSDTVRNLVKRTRAAAK